MGSIELIDIAIWFGLAAAGFFVSVFFDAAKKRAQYFIANKTRSTAFDGTWYCYHVTRKEKGHLVVLESCWDVSKSISSDFSIKTYKPEEDTSQSSYFGEGKKDEHSSVVIQFKSQDGNSVSTFRTKFPFPGSDSVAGVWIGVDYTHTMIASTFLLSKTQMDAETAKNILMSNFESIDNICITQR